jgi:oxepin-CoA hydrolase / 3-oxo-5,6-dehydrosuberyl-CoA semialdehyde dehydrogenase
MKKLSTSNIETAFKKLSDTNLAIWGKMTPQQMVEHLELALVMSYQMQYGSAKKPTFKQNLTKWVLLNIVKKLPKGLKNPLAAKGMPPLRHSNLNDAKKSLIENLERLQSEPTRAEYSKKAFFSPSLGKLSLNELEKFHLIHFKHHFNQFHLI